MEILINKARQMLGEYRKSSYSFGLECLNEAGKHAAEFGSEALLIVSSSDWAASLRKKISLMLKENNIRCLKVVDTPSPDTPMQDVKKLAGIISSYKPECIVCVGGGSAIDCAKAANIAASLGTDDLEPFFGVDKVGSVLKGEGKKLYPLVAVQCNAASSSHLTKNAVVSFPDIGQKKLITDMAIVPPRAVFDYSVTFSQGRELTIDGALDGLSHALEVYYGLDRGGIGEEVCLTSISMIVKWLPLLIKDLNNLKYREAIGLASDLGGYALMLGGTSGPHLNSFSMIDIATHGRACGILNPYYTVFYAPAIVQKMNKLNKIFKDYINTPAGDDPRSLGEALANGMFDFYASLGFPVRLDQLEGFSDISIRKMLEAAKNPQLEMKLKSMPVPLSPDLINEYMGSILNAAVSGNLKKIKNFNIA